MDNNKAQNCTHTIVFKSDNVEFNKIIVEVLDANGLEVLVNRTAITKL